MKDSEYLAIIAAAKSRIEAMDKIDADNGNDFPIPLDVCLGNVEAAIDAAIRCEAVSIMADALIMLKQRNDPTKVRWSPR